MQPSNREINENYLSTVVAQKGINRAKLLEYLGSARRNMLYKGSLWPRSWGLDP